MLTQIDQFLALVEAYRAATGLAEATVSTRALHDGKQLGMIRSGRDIGVRRIAEACQWFSDNWPKGAVWPAEIPRPPVVMLPPAPPIPDPAEAQP